MSKNKKLKINRRDRNDITRALSLLTQIGLNIVVIIFISVAIGNFLDSRLGTAPWMLFLMLVIGVISAFKSLYTIAMNSTDGPRLHKEKKQDKETSNSTESSGGGKNV